MFLTVCTPTYNREHTLPRLYESLVNQEDKDFEWVIVDDGSTDNTRELIKMWIINSDFPITYIYQSNQGKHAALNKGMDAANGKLFTCLDSDDWFYTNATKLVKENWEFSSNQNLAGLIALDTFEDGGIIGSKLPESIQFSNWIDLIFKFKVTGDKAYFFDTEIIKQYPFPVFENNRHMPPSYQYFKISKKYNLKLLNMPLKYVEYMEDGISRNKYKKYFVAPDNFTYYRIEIMDQIPSIRRKLINGIHYNATNMIGNKSFKVNKIQHKLIYALTKPLGYLLHLLIKWKNN